MRLTHGSETKYRPGFGGLSHFSIGVTGGAAIDGFSILGDNHDSADYLPDTDRLLDNRVDPSLHRNNPPNGSE
jgi:hypothetical protein